MKYIDAELIKSTKSLYNDIDSCIDGLLTARVSHNQESEGKALFRMEGLMVATLQQLDCIINSLQQEQPQVADASKMEQSEVDLEKEIKRYQEHYILVRDIGFSLNWMDIETTARHFYELGLKARKEE